MPGRSFRICYDEGDLDGGQERGTLSSFTLAVPSSDVPAADLVTCVREHLAIPPSQPLTFTLEPEPGAAPGAEVLPLSAALPDGTCLHLRCGPPRKLSRAPSASPAAVEAPQQQLEADGATGHAAQFPRSSRTALLDGRLGEVPREGGGRTGSCVRCGLRESSLPPSFKEINTDLANERTVLAWVRTGLAVIRTVFSFATLSGLTGKEQTVDVLVTIMLAVSALGTLLVGWQRFLVIRALGVLQARRLAIWPILAVFVFVAAVCCLATMLRQPRKLLSEQDLPVE